jgi:hypothetical protein
MPATPRPARELGPCANDLAFLLLVSTQTEDATIDLVND